MEIHIVLEQCSFFVIRMYRNISVFSDFTGRMAPDGERGFNPPQSKSTSKKKAEDSSRRLHSSSVNSDKERKHLEKDRSLWECILSYCCAFCFNMWPVYSPRSTHGF